jgi:hypothetical protein
LGPWTLFAESTGEGYRESLERLGHDLFHPRCANPDPNPDADADVHSHSDPDADADAHCHVNRDTLCYHGCADDRDPVAHTNGHRYPLPYTNGHRYPLPHANVHRYPVPHTTDRYSDHRTNLE